MKAVLGIMVVLVALGCGKKQDNDEMAGMEEFVDRAEPRAPAPFADPQEEQSMGFYSRGTLKNASLIPNEGLGFVKMFRPRERKFGNTSLIDTLKKAAIEMQIQFPASERLQFADFSSEFGGQQSGHASHQNGLDADVIYFRNDRREYDPDEANVDLEEFVEDGKMTANFDIVRNWELLKYLVVNAQVGRIFVDQILKKEFCKYARSIDEYDKHTEVLRRLRHWRNHANHFHLRLKCAVSDVNCIEQQEPPHGSGC